jgi:membrane-associated phospholipid phosphatase
LPNSLGSTPLISRAILTGIAPSLAVGLALSLAAAVEPRFPGDLTLARGIQSLSTSWLDTVMKAVTFIGKTYVAGASIVTLSVTLALLRRWPETAAFLGGAVMEGAVQLLKSLVSRPRPPEELLRIMESGTSGSFPSGHVYHAVVFGGLLLALVVPSLRPKWLRSAVATLVLLLVIVVVVSRVYLGAHWPSDVLGSVALLVYLCRRLRAEDTASQESGVKR